MTTNTQGNDRPVVLVTGSAQRIGAAIVSMLHTTGYNTVIHYLHSSAEADALVARLNAQRKNSATAINADLNDIAAIRNLATRSLDTWGRIDALVNSASAFYPTPVATATEQQWDDLISSNMKAPFFLSQALAPALATQQGSIINIADIYAEKPLHEHTIYCMAKAANVMLTKSLARELAPQVRVNGIAPGAILWPETGGATNEGSQQSILEKIPLKRTGTAEDIASTVLFLLRDVPYISGQIIAVDGGRSIFM